MFTSSNPARGNKPRAHSQTFWFSTTSSSLPGAIKEEQQTDGSLANWPLEQKAVHGRDHFGFANGVFVFCYVFDVSSYLDRKNPFALIEAFRREFQDSQDVLLYLKLSNAGHDQTRVQELEDAVRGAPNIRIFNGLFTEEEIISLHNAIDCLVSPYRSEGFGFNIAEAMYFGKPVIATRYSSNLDYMNDENGYLIDLKLAPLERDAGPYLRNSVWAQPSGDHLASLMRRVFENPEERARKGERAALEIRTNYSAQAVGRLMAKQFEEIGLQEPSLRRAILLKHAIPVNQHLFARNLPEELVDEICSLKRRPLISIATPVYNVAGKYLQACIESVRAQWYPFWELCLCDD